MRIATYVGSCRGPRTTEHSELPLRLAAWTLEVGGMGPRGWRHRPLRSAT